MQKDIEFFCACDIDQVFSILSESRSINTHLLAGGTDLIPALRSGMKKADCLVDISKIGLNYIKHENNEIKIGALTTFRTIARNQVIRSELPVLACAANQVGAVQTRSLATIGGNLCSAVPCADSAPPLLVLDARLRLVSPDHERCVAIKDFFTGPRKTILQSQEILTEIIVPLFRNRKASFIKIGRRKAMTLSVVSGAASMQLDDNGNMQNVRIAMGSVAPTPLRIFKAEELLNGKKPFGELFEQAGKIAMEEVKPISDLRASEEYRRLLSDVVVKRCLADNLRQFGTQE